MPVASELLVKVGADTKELESGLSRADKQVSGFAKSASVLGSVATAGFVALGAAAVGLGAGLASAVSSASGFQSVISQVGAVSGASGQELQQLSDLALKMGADTAFSASEAAQAMAELAKGGVAVEDMASILPGTLDLAAAGGIGLAEAATIATDAMAIFGKQGVTMDQVANAFAGAANISSISVSDMAEAMKYAGPVAASFGLSLEDTSAAIALLGANGLKGSQAGTGLRTVLTSLAAPTDKARGLMNDLGLQFFDSTGKMKDMAGISDELKTKLGGMSDAQRAATLQTLFGVEGMNAAIALMGTGENSIQSYTEKLRAAASAHATGAAMMDNFAGSMDQLKGSIETAAITIGLLLLPSLRELVDWATKAVNAAIPLIKAWGPSLLAGIKSGIGQAIAIVQSFGTAIMATFQSLKTGDFSNLFGPLLNAVQTAFGSDTAAKVALFVSGLVTNLQLARDAVITAGQAFSGDWVSSDKIATPVRLIGEAFTLLGDTVRAIQNPVATFSGWMDTLAAKLPVLEPVTSALAGAFARWAPQIGLVTAAFVGLGPAVSIVGAILPTLVGAFTGLGPIISMLTSTLPLLGTIIGAIGLPITALIAAVALLAVAWTQNWGGIRDATMPVIQEIVAFVTGTLLPGLMQLGTFLAANVVPAFVAGWALIQQGVSAALAVILPLVQQFSDWFTVNLLPAIMTLVAVAVPAFQQMGAAVMGAIQAALPGIQAFIAGVVALGAAVLPIIQAVATMIMDSLGPAIMAIVDWATTVIPQFAAAWVTVWGIIGPVIGEIAAFIGDTLTAIAGFISAHSSEIIGILQGAWDIISGVIEIAFSIITGIISAGLQLISGDWEGAWNTIKETASNVWDGIKQVVQGAIDVVTNTVSVGVAAVATAAAAAWELVKTAAGNAWQWVQDRIAQVVEAIKTTASNAWDSIKSTASTAWDGVKTTVSNALDSMNTAVSNGVDTVITTMAGIPGRITSAVGDLSSTLYSAGQSVIDGLISGIKAGLGGLGDALGGVGQFIKDHKGPPEKDAVMLFESGQLIMQGLIDGIDDKTLDLEKKLADVTSSIAKAATDMLDAFRAIASFDFANNSPTGSDLGWFGFLVSSLIATMQDAAKGFSEEALKAVGDFADAVSKVGSSIKSAVEGLTLLGKTDWANISPDGNAMGWFMFLVSSLVETFRQAALSFDQDGLDAATSFADAVGKITGVLKTATDGLSALRKFTPPAEATVSVFMRSLADLMEKFGTWAGGFEADGLEHSTVFADAVGKVTGVLDNGVKGLVALKDFAAPAEAAVSAFLLSLSDMMEKFGTWAGGFEADGLAASATFAEAAGKVVAVIGPAVDGFAKLANLTAPSESAISALAAGIRAIVQKFADMATMLDSDGIKATGDFAAAANAALGAAKTGVELFAAMAGDKDKAGNNQPIQIPSATAIDQLMAGIRYVVAKFTQMASEMQNDGIKQMQTFAAAAGQVLAAAKSGTDLFKQMEKLAVPSAAAIDFLLGTIGYVISQTKAIATGIGVEGLAQATAFATGALNVFNTIKSALELFPKLLEWKDKPTDTLTEIWKALEGALVQSAALVARSDAILQDSITFKSNMQKALSNFGQGLGGVPSVPNDWVPSNFPVPAFAAGGIVTKPTLALVGEAGPEAVVPLSRYQGSGGGGGVTVHVAVQGNVYNADQMQDIIFQGLAAGVQRGRRIPA